MLSSSLLPVVEFRMEWITGNENLPSVRSSQNPFVDAIFERALVNSDTRTRICLIPRQSIG